MEFVCITASELLSTIIGQVISLLEVKSQDLRPISVCWAAKLKGHPLIVSNVHIVSDMEMHYLMTWE
jgi:hypothetical protein